MMHNSPAGWRGGRRHGGGSRRAARAAILTAAALAVLPAALPAVAATASAAPPRAAGPGAAMAISPPRLTVPAGQVSKVQRLEIENRGRSVLRVHTERSAFNQLPNGSTVLVPNAPYSAANWVTITPARIIVPAGAHRFVRIRIRVPAHAEPGDHHLAIIFLLPPARGRGNIHVSAGIGVPTVITVPGRVTDDLRVLRISAPGFSAGGPLRLRATVRESGDVHHSFRGAGNRLTAMIGRTAVTFPPLTVLRGSTVTLTSRWADPPAFCVCHLRVTVTSDLGRQTASTTVIIFPVLSALITLGAMTALVIAILLTRRRQARRLAAAYEAGRRGTRRRIPGTNIRPADLE
jgi:hypothetical protein